MRETIASLKAKIQNLEEALAASGERNKALEKQIGGPEFILVEIAERNFLLAKKMIGSKGNYNFTATCRNRAQANNIAAMLNQQHNQT